MAVSDAGVYIVPTTRDGETDEAGPRLLVGVGVKLKRKDYCNLQARCR